MYIYFAVVANKALGSLAYICKVDCRRLVL